MLAYRVRVQQVKVRAAACLHTLELTARVRRYHLKDVIVGKIYFLLVRIKVSATRPRAPQPASVSSGTVSRLVPSCVAITATFNSAGCGLLYAQHTFTPCQKLGSTPSFSCTELYMCLTLLIVPTVPAFFYPYISSAVCLALARCGTGVRLVSSRTCSVFAKSDLPTPPRCTPH